MSYDRPVPDRSREAEQFWEAAAKGHLEIQQCESCNQHVFPPRFVCPHCLSNELTWTIADGGGIVYSYSVIHHPPSKVWEEAIPYTVGVVRLLPEDVFLFTQIVNVHPTDVSIGLPVNVTFDHVTEGVSLPKFQPHKE